MHEKTCLSTGFSDFIHILLVCMFRSIIPRVIFTKGERQREALADFIGLEIKHDPVLYYAYVIHACIQKDEHICGRCVLMIYIYRPYILPYGNLQKVRSLIKLLTVVVLFIRDKFNLKYLNRMVVAQSDVAHIFVELIKVVDDLLLFRCIAQFVKHVQYLQEHSAGQGSPQL